MTTETIKGGVYFNTDSLNHTWAQKYKFHTGIAENFASYVLIAPHEFTFEVPDDFDPRPQLVAALKVKRGNLRAEFAAACTEIERQISQYQAIECSEVTA